MFDDIGKCRVRSGQVGHVQAKAAAFGPAVQAQNKVLLRVSTPAVPDDWHGKMWTVFKDTLDKSAPGEFYVQINLNATLFKQGYEKAIKDATYRARILSATQPDRPSPCLCVVRLMLDDLKPGGGQEGLILRR